MGERAGGGRTVRGLVRGPHRLSAGRRGHAPAQPDRLHAQPPAHGDRLFPDQGPAASTGAGASAISPSSCNDFDLAANNGGWQWAASTGCDAAALLPHLQSGHASRKSSTPRASSSAATCRSWPSCGDKEIHAPWLAGGQGGGLPGADRRSCRSAREHAGALRRWSRARPSADVHRRRPPCRSGASRSCAWAAVWQFRCRSFGQNAAHTLRRTAPDSAV